jgi:hypothetical protein
MRHKYRITDRFRERGRENKKDGREREKQKGYIVIDKIHKEKGIRERDRQTDREERKFR